MKMPIAVVVAVALAGACPAFAQDETPQTETPSVEVATADAVAPEAIEPASDVAAATDAAPAIASAAAPVIGEPIPVELRRGVGNANMLRIRPRVAIGGYNIGAVVTATVSASSGGSLFGGGMGARARMNFELGGIDRALLERVADAAEADLIAQLQAAGFDTTPSRDVFANGRLANFRAEDGQYVGQEPVLQGDMLVVGPSDVGALRFMGVGRMGFGGNANAVGAVSQELDATVLFPNLAFDFVQTSGSGNRMLGNRANVGGEARFGVNAYSRVEAIASRNGRFADGWVRLETTATSVDDAFATMEQTSQSSNTGAAVVSALLGAGMQHGRRSDHVVQADPAAYEALALRAARGFNAAIVEQLRAARGQ